MKITFKCKKCKKTVNVDTIMGEKAARQTTVYKKKLCPRCYDEAYDWQTNKKKTR